jgi:hypothetical protein
MKATSENKKAPKPAPKLKDLTAKSNPKGGTGTHAGGGHGAGKVP